MIGSALTEHAERHTILQGCTLVVVRRHSQTLRRNGQWFSGFSLYSCSLMRFPA
jgi:hypothetical protein